MKIAVKGGNLYVLSGPEKFNHNEISISLREGVIIRQRYSKTMNAKYRANICPNCRGFTGQFYLPECLHSALEGSYKYKLFDVGYFCDYCFQGYS